MWALGKDPDVVFVRSDCQLEACTAAGQSAAAVPEGQGTVALVHWFPQTTGLVWKGCGSMLGRL